MLKKFSLKAELVIILLLTVLIFSTVTSYLGIEIFTNFLSGPLRVTGFFGGDVSLFQTAFFIAIASVVLLFLICHFLKTISEYEKKAGEAGRAKSEFVSMASHQLRTPLANVNWYAEMLLAGDAGKLNDTQKSYLEEVYNSNQRMIELVNALLNVDLGTFAVDPEKLDLREISDSIISELSPQVKNKEIRIEKKYQENLPMVNADPRLLRIVFQNILSNSVKYTPTGGKIGIEMKKQDDNTIIVSISDTGCGIPKSQQKKVFTRLFRADNVIQKSEGTGLGLYIAKAVMDQTNSKIWFESPARQSPDLSARASQRQAGGSRHLAGGEENKGTTFFFTVPIKGIRKKKGVRLKK